MLKTILRLRVVLRRLAPWRIRIVLHCCKSAKSFYQLSRKQLMRSAAVGVKCGIPVVGKMVAVAGSLGPIESEYRCKKQREHFSVTEQKT
jgi:hypothetical protein